MEDSGDLVLCAGLRGRRRADVVEGQPGAEEFLVAAQERDERLEGADEEDDDANVYEEEDGGGPFLSREEAPALGARRAKGARVSGISRVCRLVLALFGRQGLVFGGVGGISRAAAPMAQISPGAGHDGILPLLRRVFWPGCDVGVGAFFVLVVSRFACYRRVSSAVVV